MRNVLLFGFVLLVLLGGACTRKQERASQGRAACDSISAVRVALDSLAHLDPFRSAVLRFARDSQGIRIVTMPDQQSSGLVVDGMAVVHVNDRCLITSLVQTDSA